MNIDATLRTGQSAATRTASAGRIIAAAVASLLAGTVLLAALVWSAAGGILAEELQITGASIGRAVSRDIEKALAGQVPLERLVDMDTFLRQAVENDPLAAYVAVADTAGRVLYTGRRDDAAAWVAEAAVPIRRHDQVIGEVRVGLDVTLLLRGALPMVAGLVGCLAAGILALALAGRALWRGSVVRPATMLASVMTAAGTGRLTRPAVAETTGGLRRLAQSVDVMVKELLDKHATVSELEYAVRAGHFDPEVLGRIGRQTAPMHSAFGTAESRRAAVSDLGHWALSRLITVVAVVTLCLAVAATFLAVDQRRAWFADALRDETVAGLRGLWRSEQASIDRRLEQAGRAAAANTDLRAALAAQTVAGLRAPLDSLAQVLGEQSGISRLELVGRDGQPLYTSQRKAGQTVGAVDPAAVLRAMQDNRPIHGLLQDETRNYSLVHALPVVQDGAAVGAVVVTRDMGQVVDDLARAVGNPLLLIDLRGRAAFAADPALRDLALDDLPTVQPAVAEKSFAGRLLRLVQIPLSDAAGRPVARLVSVLPVDEVAAERSRLKIVSGILALAVLVAGILALVLFLRRVFQPLHRSMAAVSALSLGALHVDVPEAGGTIEGARMSAAARRLKEREASLVQLQVSRAKQRRRQQRFIRLQMQALADTLEPDAREAVLKDLEKLEQLAAEAVPQDGDATIAAKSGDDLTLLGAAFQNLAHRIRTQYQRLADLVQELREALSTKMAFLALQQELDIARKLQLSMLPKRFPERSDFAVFAAMEPAKEVGGDFYDLFELDDQRYGFVVADVSGKGVPAALFMAMSRTLLKATAIFGIPPGRCLAKLNDMLEESNEQSMFVTVFYGILDTGRGVFTYANGGHNPPYLLKADGSVSALPTTRGTALAIFPGLDYAEHEIHLEPGDSILMYTDGITEAFDPEEAMFGDDKLIAQLERCHGMAPEQLVPVMMQAVHGFARGAPQSDDMTCLALRLQASVAEARN